MFKQWLKQNKIKLKSDFKQENRKRAYLMITEVRSTINPKANGTANTCKPVRLY